MPSMLVLRCLFMLEVSIGIRFVNLRVSSIPVRLFVRSSAEGDRKLREVSLSISSKAGMLIL